MTHDITRDNVDDYQRSIQLYYMLKRESWKRVRFSKLGTVGNADQLEALFIRALTSMMFVSFNSNANEIHKFKMSTNSNASNSTANANAIKHNALHDACPLPPQGGNVMQRLATHQRTT